MTHTMSAAPELSRFAHAVASAAPAASSWSANRKLAGNASAVSDAPRPTPEIYLPLITGRVRYSCLKEAAGEEAPMQIQWGCRDEKGLGNG